MCRLRKTSGNRPAKGRFARKGKEEKMGDDEQFMCNKCGAKCKRWHIVNVFDGSYECECGGQYFPMEVHCLCKILAREDKISAD